MITRLTSAGKFLLPVLILLLGLGAAQAGDLGLDVVLVWGTNSDKSPDSHHKPVEADISKKMESGPYKWKHYFEVNRQTVQLPENAPVKKLTMSPQCNVEMKNVGKGKIEVNLIGGGKSVSKVTHPITNEPLLIGGPAPGDNSWFVVVKQKK